MYVVIVMFFRWKFETDVRASPFGRLDRKEEEADTGGKKTHTVLPDTCDAPRPFGDIFDCEGWRTQKKTRHHHHALE